MTLKHSLIAVALGLTTSLAGAGAFATTASAQDSLAMMCAKAHGLRDADRIMQEYLVEDGQPTAAANMGFAADAAQDFMDHNRCPD